MDRDAAAPSAPDVMTLGPTARRRPLLLLCLTACAGSLPPNLGVGPSGLAPCPSSPNCVSTAALDDRHHVPPFQLTIGPDEAWRAMREAVAALPRTRIVDESPDYLRAECRSAIFRFVDDLELHLDPAAWRIAVRSASRVGHSDLGANRRRVEALRASLAARGVLR